MITHWLWTKVTGVQERAPLTNQFNARDGAA